MDKLVLPLSSANDISLAGGKAAALAKLINAGFNVPAGFVVTTAGQDAKAKILAEFDRLGAKKVAVRSSAVAEDGSKDAWAGQLDTFLDITRDKLMEKVAACFDSAKSDRAKAYAAQKKISSGDVAVIVQEMVPSDISGVAFSAHPVTNNRGQVVIEAVKGLGEDLVSGRTTPDTYIVDKSSDTVLERHLVATRVLDEKQIKTLSETVQRIEMIFSFPVDVEWAFANGELFILQSRPITTLG